MPMMAVGMPQGSGLEVLDWRSASVETSQDYQELLTRLWKRGMGAGELMVSDGLTAIVGAAQVVYPAARRLRSLAHRSRGREGVSRFGAARSKNRTGLRIYNARSVSSRWRLIF